MPTPYNADTRNEIYEYLLQQKMLEYYKNHPVLPLAQKVEREPNKTELKYFEKNPTVGGMAAEDGKIIINPYSNLNDGEKHAIRINEFTRLHLRDNPVDFTVTPQQAETFKNYGSPQDIQHTILGRIISGDPSSMATPEQQLIGNQLMKSMLGQ